jgi:ADP-ribose pyrophosphatase
MAISLPSLSCLPSSAPDANLPLAEVRVDGGIVHQGHFLTVQCDKVALPDGKITQREYIRHPGAVVILPLFDDGSVLLERQFRYPLDRVFVEFPAGKIDAGEDPLVCAKRDTATDWKFFCTIHNAIAYSDEHLDLYFARGLVAGPQRLDDGEFLETFSASLEQLLAWVRSGDITDVKTIIGAFWLEKLVAGTWTAPHAT